MSKQGYNFEIDLLGVAVVIFFIGAAITLSINAYQEGEKEQLEMQLKIEQEKNKQLQHERADSTIRNN